MRSPRPKRPFWYAVFALTDDARYRSERDFYRRLLELHRVSTVEPLLQEALQLAVEITGAEQVYLRLNDVSQDTPHPASLAHQCTTDDLTQIESNISQGIIAEALAQGRTIQTPSALLDARFRDRGSVRAKEIAAVLCAPVGTPEPLGVLYMQGHKNRGPFDDDVLTLVETFAEHVGLVVHRILENQARKEAEDPTQPYRAQLNAEGLIGRSLAVAELLKTIASVAPLDKVTVLLSGQTGTGKTVVAQILANSGSRAGKPFHQINCANLSEALIEADLFGARAGAHSTASQDRQGKLEVAEGGTIFLDEVAELTLSSQAKLLQFLQEGKYYPLGGTELQHADVRIISATNKDLHALVRDGKFREDLLYRLEVLPIRVPSLAERSEDIPELVRYFLRRAAENNRVAVLEPSRGTLEAARQAPWPGNIRQLENKCTSAVVHALRDGATVIEPQHLFPEAVSDDTPVTLQAATRKFQKAHLEAALKRNQWNVAKTARELDITRSHLYNLIETNKLQRPG